MELTTITDELREGASHVSEEQLDQLIELIDAHERIFVYGTGRSGLMLKTFAMRLMQMGYTSFVVGETTTPATRPGDLLVVASASGETGSVVDAVRGALAQGVDVVAISGPGSSSLTKLVDPLICIEAGTKYATSAASVQPLGSLFEQMLLLIFDGTILRISNRREGANDQMAARHASIE